MKKNSKNSCFVALCLCQLSHRLREPTVCMHQKKNDHLLMKHSVDVNKLKVPRKSVTSSKSIELLVTWRQQFDWGDTKEGNMTNEKIGVEGLF